MDFVICARNINDDKFGSEPGKTTLLCVPSDNNTIPKPSHIEPDSQKWVKMLLSALTSSSNAGSNTPMGDILIFVHGYRNSQETVMERHRLLKNSLKSKGFNGLVVSFDWPSAGNSAIYIEDRHDAKKTALQLVSDGISLLCKYQQPHCQVNIHVLAHSMGAFVVREAFDDADDSSLAKVNWRISQLMLIGADISSDSLRLANSTTDSLYRHCARLTNYSNAHDNALAISNAKRLGIAPRVGRKGLPDSIPPNAVNVDCSDYWKSIPEQKINGSWDHSWYFHDSVFIEDLLHTMSDIDRDHVGSREILSGKRILKKA